MTTEITPWRPSSLRSAATRLNDAVDALLRRTSKETISAYQADLLRFSKFLGEEDSVRAAAKLFGMTKGDATHSVEQYQDSLEAAGFAPATINRRVAVVKKLAAIGRRAEIIDWALEVPRVPLKRVKTNLKGPGVFALTAMLNVSEQLAETGKPRHVRNHGILRMHTDLGVRRGAVSGFLYEKLDCAQRKVELRMKGGDWERFALPEPTWEALRAWLAIRGDAPGPVFYGLHPGSKRTALTGKSIFGIIREIAARVGLVVHPHAIRHTTITAILKTADLRTAQHFARHKSSKTTAIYDDAIEETGDEAAASLVKLYLEKH